MASSSLLLLALPCLVALAVEVQAQAEGVLRMVLACLQPAGSLIAKTRSLDQARAVVTFLDAASEKTLRSTVALTAARGRGKSAALGLAIAGALALGYSNIFVTAPSPENLRTLFEFIFKVGTAWASTMRPSCGQLES